MSPAWRRKGGGSRRRVACARPSESHVCLHVTHAPRTPCRSTRVAWSTRSAGYKKEILNEPTAAPRGRVFSLPRIFPSYPCTCVRFPCGRPRRGSGFVSCSTGLMHLKWFPCRRLNFDHLLRRLITKCLSQPPAGGALRLPRRCRKYRCAGTSPALPRPLLAGLCPWDHVPGVGSLEQGFVSSLTAHAWVCQPGSAGTPPAMNVHV